MQKPTRMSAVSAFYILVLLNRAFCVPQDASRGFTPAPRPLPEAGTLLSLRGISPNRGIPFKKSGQKLLFFSRFLGGDALVYVIAQGHEAVAQMDVFHRDVRVLDRKVVVAEIPKALDAQLDKLVGQGRRLRPGDT